MRTLVLVVISMCLSSKLMAWDGVNTGKISNVYVAPNDQRTFRVAIEGKNSLCGNEFDWAYIHEDEEGFNTVVSVLLAAKMGQSTVTLYSNKNPQDNNYCKIGYVAVD